MEQRRCQTQLAEEADRHPLADQPFTLGIKGVSITFVRGGASRMEHPMTILERAELRNRDHDDHLGTRERAGFS